jgi:sugar lactone lactonase YvrE
VLKENKLKLKRFEYAVATALVVLLAGCGGGGGGGSSGGGSTGGTNPTTPATQYTLGGTVYGLAAGTPVTVSNGGEKKIIASNGAFTLDTKLNAGASYNIEAIAPAGYTCQVGNGSGTINANLNTATIACAPVLGNQVAGQVAGLSTALKEPLAVTADANGNVYVLDAGPHSVFKLDKASQQITTFAGGTGKPGTADGAAATAQFWLGGAGGAAVDAQGNLFVSDGCNGEIRKIAADGTVSTLAGGGTVVCKNVAPQVATAGQVNATGTAARFERPGSLIVDTSGNVIVIDSQTTQPAVRIVSPAGVVTTRAYPQPDPSATITLQRVARAPDGGLFFSDSNNRIWKDVNGTLVLFVGKLSGLSYEDGTGANARFRAITGMTFANGDMYVTDLAKVRKVTGAGVVTTLAGNDNRASVDGQGAAASFSTLLSITFDGTDLIVVDSGQEILRKVSLTGAVSTVKATPALRASVDGPGIAARFGSFSSLAAGTDGNLYSVDPASHVVRKATPAGFVTTVGGKAGTPGNDNGALATASFNTPQRIAAGKDGSLWIAQTDGVRRILNNEVTTPDASIKAVNLAVEPSGNAVVVTGTNSGEVIRVTPAGARTVLVNTAQIAALFPARTGVKFTPQSVVVDGAGNIYIADTATAAVYKYSTAGVLSVFAGTPFNETGNIDGAVGVATLGFYEIDHLAIDDAGNLYLSGQGGVRKISPAGVVSSPTYGWGNADIGAVAVLGGKLYGMTRYALLQSNL